MQGRGGDKGDKGDKEDKGDKGDKGDKEDKGDKGDKEDKGEMTYSPANLQPTFNLQPSTSNLQSCNLPLRGTLREQPPTVDGHPADT